jgi:hypothetical protein
MLFYISWEALLASQPRMTLNEDTPGVSSIDYDIDRGKKVEELKVQARASRWAAPPGTVVMVEEMGAADDRWVVVEHSRGLYERDAEITLKRPGKSKKEPAAATESVNLHGQAAAHGLGALTRAYAKAKAISKKHYPYRWGGGHNNSFSGPYDCSGYVSAVLHAAGWLKHPLTSGSLEHWGHAGRGKFLTVYANGEHTFMVFHMPHKGLEHFGTGRWGTSRSGAGYKPQMHPTGGFVARHWPGF